MQEPVPRELTTHRCVLKMLLRENALDLFSIYGDQETMSYMQRPVVESVEACEEMILKWENQFCRGISFRWGVFRAESPDRMVGTAALHYW